MRDDIARIVDGFSNKDVAKKMRGSTYRAALEQLPDIVGAAEVLDLAPATRRFGAPTVLGVGEQMEFGILALTEGSLIFMLTTTAVGQLTLPLVEIEGSKVRGVKVGGMWQRNVAIDLWHGPNQHTFVVDDAMRGASFGAALQEECVAAKRAAARTSAAGPMIVTQGTSVAEELRKLAELRDEGILTSDEFDRQKAALLGR